MKLIPLQPTLRSELYNLADVANKLHNRWRRTLPLHVSSSFSNGVAEDVIKNSPPKVEFIKRRKLSALKGKVTKMSAQDIDEQLKSLRNEWQRDI